MLKSFCLIPARSGSKGLHDKNILDLEGRPVLAYTIDACRQSGLFDAIYVATDSPQYADIAAQYGATVPFLESAEMAGDNVPSIEPVLFFYKELAVQADLLWCMQPTSPLRSSEDIVRAYKILEENPHCDFALGTTEIDPHYFHWALKDADDGFSELYFGSEMLVDRSQLKLKVFRPNGAIKVGRTASVIRDRSYFGNRLSRVEIPEDRAIHIRTLMDLEICRFLLKGR